MRVATAAVGYLNAICGVYHARSQPGERVWFYQMLWMVLIGRGADSSIS